MKSRNVILSVFFLALILAGRSNSPATTTPTAPLPGPKVGAFPQNQYDEAQANRWTVISIKNNRKHRFAWEK